VRSLALCLILTLTLAATTAAGPKPGLTDFDQAVNQARQALLRRDPAATLGALRRAVAAAWRKLPFTAIEVHLVAAPPTGFGEYIPRVDNVYRPGEPLILYLEPVGYTVRYDPEQQVYRYSLAADFNLVDAWGRVVSGRRNFGRFQGQSRHFPDRLPLTFTYSLAGLPPGEYRVETVLRDLLGHKSHTVVTPILIEGH
jgi:hypothetical protein